VLCGLPASGKTTLARELESAGAVRFSPDEWLVRLQLDGSDDAGRIRVELLMLDLAFEVAATGATVVLEHGYWLRRHRDETRERARRLGLAVEQRFLDVPVDELLRRIEVRNRDVPADWLRISEADLRQWASMLEPPTADELALFDAPLEP
jgi:predicted kinase